MGHFSPFPLNVLTSRGQQGCAKYSHHVKNATANSTITAQCKQSKQHPPPLKKTCVRSREQSSLACHGFPSGPLLLKLKPGDTPLKSEELLQIHTSTTQGGVRPKSFQTGFAETISLFRNYPKSGLSTLLLVLLHRFQRAAGQSEQVTGS